MSYPQTQRSGCVILALPQQKSVNTSCKLHYSPSPKMHLDDFYNLHAGETILLVGNGANLHLTPPAWFDYPSIGMNTIHKYNGWKPTYYTTVDNRVWREFGNEIEQVFSEIPKFIPTPTLDCWQG